MFSNIAFIQSFKSHIKKIIYKVYKNVFDPNSKKWVEITTNFRNQLQLRSHLQQFINTFLKTKSLESLKKPGVLFSIPENEFF